MNQLIELAPKKPDLDDFDIVHLYCCNENVALCGRDISDIEFGDSYENLCVVCKDLEEQDYCDNCSNGT